MAPQVNDTRTLERRIIETTEIIASASESAKRYATSAAERKSEIIKRLAEEGLVNVSDRNVSLTEKGFYLSNSILAEIL